MGGAVALACGDLASARRRFREALAIFPRATLYLSHRVLVIWAGELATALAMSGDCVAATRVLDDVRVPHAGSMEICDIDLTLAEAWLSAAGGATSEAIALARGAASDEQQRGRPAREVMCLQTAAQFGDATGADRLTELTSLVQGPRVKAAADACGRVEEPRR